MPGYNPNRKRKNNQRRQRAQHNVTPAVVQASTPPVTRADTTMSKLRRALSLGRICGWVMCVLLIVAVVGANSWKNAGDNGMVTVETGPAERKSG